MADPNLKITATEFERLVRDWILKQGGDLTSLEVRHDLKVEAHHSTYQIDALAKFEAFGGADPIAVPVRCVATDGPDGDHKFYPLARLNVLEPCPYLR